MSNLSMDIDHIDLSAILQSNSPLTDGGLTDFLSTEFLIPQTTLSSVSEFDNFTATTEAPSFNLPGQFSDQGHLFPWSPASSSTPYSSEAAQNPPNSIEIVAQPQASHRASYLSDFENGQSPRYIRANPSQQSERVYTYPSIRIPPIYLTPDQNYFIRIRLSTVEFKNGMRYIHPYSLTISEPDSHPEVLRYEHSLFYSISQNEIMTFDKLMLIKTVQERLKGYGDLLSFETGQPCLNTERSPRRMVTDYELKKSQLGFSVVQWIPAHNTFQCLETIFSTVMTEKSEGVSSGTEAPRKSQGARSKKTIQRPVLHQPLPGPSEEVQTLDDWRRIFEDEFTVDGALDRDKWTLEEGTGDKGWGNNEKQYYTRNVDKNARCENSHLLIEARKEPFRGSQYTSARVRSSRAFLYGRLQIRAKMPSARGTLPSLFLLPEKRTYGHAMWPENGEMYLAARLGHTPSRIRASVTTKTNSPLSNNLPINEIEVPDATTQFKVYTLLWEEDEIEMFVGPDEANALQTRVFLWEKRDKDWKGWPFDQPFHLIMNLAVGGDVAGDQIDDAQFPQQMEIDWVRFDQRT